MACHCVIEALLQTSFTDRPFQQKGAIIKEGRPTPELPNLTALYKDKKRSFKRRFADANYEKTLWLTGCSNLNRLFCWPCLLFNTEKTVWSSEGFCDLNNIYKAMGKHEKTKAHISGFFKLQVFGESSSRMDLQLDNQRALAVAGHNEQVKKNRHILSRLIAAVCFLVKQDLALGDEGLSKGNCIELLNYTALHDSQLEEYLKTSTVFKDKSPQIQTDLIPAISSVLNDVIQEEINKTEFVSILLNDTSEVANKSRIAICFRYIDEGGDRQERVLKFIDVNAYKTAEALFELVDQVICEYQVSNKIVAQTYDGAPIMSGRNGGLQSKIKENYPEALFVHCHNQVLNLVLQQSIGNIKECGDFFTTLSGIGSFFSKSPKKTNALTLFMKNKLSGLALSRWNFSSRLVNTVNENRVALIDFFESIINNSDEWDSESVLKAMGCVSFLNSFMACFLLDVFSSIFVHTDILFNVLQNKLWDIEYCCKKVVDVKNAIKEKHQNSFESFWKNVFEKSTEQPKKRKNKDPEVSYKSLYHAILDNILAQLTDRFEDYKNLEFKTLMEAQRFLTMKEVFPKTAFESLLKTYKRHFDPLRLRNELIVLYSAPANEICRKNAHLMLKYMLEKKLDVVLPETYKLLLLILTLPAATTECTCSASKRIKAFTSSARGQEGLTELALLSIEKQLLQKLCQNPKYKFTETVIEKFCLRTKQSDFMFK